MEASVLRQKLQVCWAIVGVTIAFAAFIFLSYRFALARGGLPFSEISGWIWIWFIVLGTLIASGIVALWPNFGRIRSRQLIFAAFYLTAAVIVNCFLHLAIACGFGD